MASHAARGCRVAAAIFGFVFVLHAWRLISHTPVSIGTRQVPMGASWLALVVSGALAWWMRRAARS